MRAKVLNLVQRDRLELVRSCTLKMSNCTRKMSTCTLKMSTCTLNLVQRDRLELVRSCTLQALNVYCTSTNVTELVRGTLQARASSRVSPHLTMAPPRVAAAAAPATLTVRRAGLYKLQVSIYNLQVTSYKS